jgi:glycosyltransferase involved in cell wall biosynthesis
MRVLAEGLSIRAGGGIQVALDVLRRLANDRSVRAAAICSHELSTQLSGDIIASFEDFVEADISSPLQFARARFRAHQLERRFEPDVVYTIFGPSYWVPTAPQVTGFGRPSLLEWRIAKRLLPGAIDSYIDYSSWKDVVRRWFLKKSRGYLVESEAVLIKLAHCLDVPTERITVMGNTFGNSFERYDFRSRRSGNSNVLVPAAYYPHKNLEIIPFVAAAMAREHPTRNFCFTLTIPNTSAPWAGIVEAARAANVSKHVRTVGAIPCSDMPALYARADCVFLPTLLECFTAVYPEAFKSGRPLVTSRRDFAQSLCDDAAVYCDPLDPEDCARKIEDVLDDEKWAQTLVSRGASRLSTHYVTPSERYSRIRTALDYIAAH